MDKLNGAGASTSSKSGTAQIPSLQGKGISEQPGIGRGAIGSPSEISEDNMEFILDIPLEITVELGRTRLLINEMLKLNQGSVIELSKMAGETMDIMANRKLIAKGEVVVLNDKYGVRLIEIVSPMERLEKLK